MTDFFISYTGADRSWAEWIASILEAANFSVVIQAWDFRPGGNFVVEMQKAAAGSARTVAVMSPEYLRSLYGMAEWAAAFAADPDGSKGKLVPVVVRETVLEGLLAPIIHINLVGLTEAPAREELIQGLVPGRIRPENVRFPGAHRFPGPAPSPPNPEAAKAALAALPLEDVPLPGPLPVGSRMPLAPNPLFVGREEDLKTLARQLKAGETSAVGQVEIAAATGLGGMGKTQLASEFVHRYGRFFAGGAFWMRFADASAVIVEVASCGQNLGLSSNFETLTIEQQARLVREAWQSPLPRLLVFDNCEDESSLVRWRPTSGGSRVLVTSRRSEWNPSLGIKTVPLRTLPRPSSIELLRRFRPDVPETEPALDGIADELGDLPLALHLAGSFLQTYRASSYGQLRTYLESLRQENLLAHPSLQGRGSGASPTDHESHVGRTFALSFERLEASVETDALAIDLLSRAAWFAPGEPIPRSLLLKTVKASPENLLTGLLAEDALRRLSDLGLLETNDRSDLVMHRLVAAWSGSVPGSEEARIAVEDTLLAESVELNEAQDLLHLLARQPHLRWVTDRALKRRGRMAARLCDELGVHLWQAGDYSGARPYLETAVALHGEFSGVDHPDTADSWNNLGRLVQTQGDYPLAYSYHTKGLVIREKALGAEHHKTMHSISNLGALLQAQGNYEEARPYFERALTILERELGPEHPDTASGLNNLGGLLRDQGDYKGARLYYERSFAIHEKVLGSEHPDTAVGLNNLGGLLRAQGDYEGARSYYQRSLAIREKALGPEHPDTAASLNGLGSLLNDQSDYEGARSYYERASAISERVLGLEHPRTATCINNIGTLLQAQGDYEGARSYYQRSLAIREKALGPEHPDTAASLNNLGSLLKDQSDYEGARSYYERASAISERVLGLEHPRTATCINNIGALLQAQGDYEGARSYYERALAIREKVLGPEHPETADSISSLGTLLVERRDLRAARSYFERALEIRGEALGQEHPETATSFRNLGLIHLQQNNLLRARWYLERALRIFTARLGTDHPFTKEVRNDLSRLPGSRKTGTGRSKKKPRH